MKNFIADLHCDLLLFLSQDPKRTAHQPEVRCSISQLQAGGVLFQVMPLFTLTEKDSAKVGRDQFSIFLKLPLIYPSLALLNHPDRLDQILQNKTIGIVAAIENASTICEEDEPLQNGFSRLEQMQKEAGIVLYVSLTWNTENRFGGGNATDIGLKGDGKRLLDFLHAKRISVDLSHTSDRLAYEIFDHIDRYSLDIPVIASHSNFRKVCLVPRNLPDDIAREIFRRKGIIGMNVIKPFVGSDPAKDFVRHVEHGLALGGEHHLCFGADFFCETDVPLPWRKKSADEYFHSGFEDGSAYPRLLYLYEHHLKLSEKILQGISSHNFRNFLNRHCSV